MSYDPVEFYETECLEEMREEIDEKAKHLEEITGPEAGKEHEKFWKMK